MLRVRAQEALGDRSHLAEFHDVVLREGVIPLSTLGRVVEEYIERKLAET
ncbi:MAG: hypothetical protein NTY63_02360 [Candidatus Bipolaricaulota bacterium]|nr:hypothetical protein [Candidatus Bipolaricaulota bacterium]